MMRTRIVVVLCACGLPLLVAGSAPAVRSVSILIDSRMEAPRWARLERQLLAENVPACREFYQKYFDDRGYLQRYANVPTVKHPWQR